MTIPIGFAQAAYQMGSNAGGDWTAVVTIGLDVTGQSTTDALYAEAIFDAFANNILDVVSSDARVNGVTIKYGPDATGRTIEHNELVVGGVGTTGMPPNVAFLARKLTGVGGRQGRGRMFVPGVPEASVDSNGALGGTPLANFQTACTAFFNDLTSADAPPVVLHGDALPPTDMTSIVALPVVATQRRRLRR